MRAEIYLRGKSSRQISFSCRHRTVFTGCNCFEGHDEVVRQLCWNTLGTTAQQCSYTNQEG